MRWLPESATSDARRVVAARAVRAFADGAVSVLLASYLSGLGMSPLEISAIVTGTLVGSAALTLAVGLWGGPRRRRLLWISTLLMAATGIGFFAFSSFAWLLVVGIVGTLNPSGGDVSVFLPTEQAVLSDNVAAAERTSLFARYNFLANLTGALGALASGLPGPIAARLGIPLLDAQRAGFVGYALIALAALWCYRGLDPSNDAPPPRAATAPLARSRGIVLRLSLLFSLDSAGGGLVVQALLALWLIRRFGLAPETVAGIFFGTSLLSGVSQLASPYIAARIGLIRTMVFTHLPAQVFLILAAFMPTAPLTILFLLLRTSLSQMDVPARQAYVMAVVPIEERAAAASVTNVPRSLAAALTPLAAGWMLARSSFGWPLVVGGAMKAIYDFLLLAQFRHIEPEEHSRPLSRDRSP